MAKFPTIKTLFVDVGGVLLTNGWEKHSRETACRKFQLDPVEMESRHRLTFEVYELGKISLDEYLSRIVFYQKRSFSKHQFKEFMFAQSKAYKNMLKLMSDLKKKYKLKIGVISNEGRELTAFRIQKFKLGHFVDFFISSCFVQMRKPDFGIYRIALDIAQTPLEECLYIEDRPMYVSVAEQIGISSILHQDFETTSTKLLSFLK